MTFQAQALPRETFAPLFDLSDEALHAHRARRVTVDAKPGYPDRLSLKDAEIGDELILVHYEHQDADSPFRASHAVFINPTAEAAQLPADVLPPFFYGRTISLRAFDTDGMIVTADLVEGAHAQPAIEAMLARPETAYIHAHFAKYGCFAARIERVVERAN